MSSRSIPYSPTTPCDVCHALGSFDLMGDNLCPLCLADEEDEDISASYRGLTRQYVEVTDETPVVYPQRSE